MARSEGRSDNGGVGGEEIPPATKKMVQNLKEIVKCSEMEIYVALKDSGMDPNEAVNRLLSQDPFRQVKSKREKKKESKDLPETKFRVSSNTSQRASRSDRGRGGSAQYSSYDPSAFQGKVAHRKENGTNSNTTSLSVPQVAVGKPNWRPSAYSNCVNMENEMSKRSLVEGKSASQANSGYQSALVVVPSQNSSADIVKTGGPQSSDARSLQKFPSENKVFKVTEQYEKQAAAPDEWPVFEPPESTNLSVKDGVATSVLSERDKLQQLSIQQEERKPSYEEDGPSVVIPNHLQVQSADCSHLSFGSFRSGLETGFYVSRFSRNNMGGTSIISDASVIRKTDNRKLEYYGEEAFETSNDEILAYRASGVAGPFDSASASQSDFLKQEYAEAAAHASRYNFTTDSTDYPHQNAYRQNLAPSYAQTSSWMQDLASFSDGVGHIDSLSSTQLAAKVPVRDVEVSYSPFPVAQSLAAKYGNTASSNNGSSISLEEALKTGLQSLYPAQKQLSVKRVASERSNYQHLAAHQNYQPTHPLGPYADVNDYSYLPQNETYMPSAFQQEFGGNSAYHQSLAAVRPQYKNSVSVGMSATIPSGYGHFGDSTTISGNYAMNPSVVTAGSSIGYDDLSTRYMDSTYSIPLQQNENSAMWHHGQGSRTVSTVSANAYNSLQGQNQHPGGFGQGQQSSLYYGDTNFNSPQMGMPLDQQLQSSRDGSLGGSYVQSKHPQHKWQNSY